MATGTTTASMSPPARLPLPAISMAMPIGANSLSTLGILLAIAHAFGLSAAQTTTWVLILNGVATLLSLALTVVYRQPLLVAWSTSSIIFLASIIGQHSFASMAGAAIVAGAVVVLLGLFGLTARLAALLPAPLIFGIVAGAVMPVVVNAFTHAGTEPTIVIGMLVAYVLGSRYLTARMPAIVFALVGGIAITWLLGRIDHPTDGWSLPVPTVTMPVFSLPAIIEITPMFVALMALQGNVSVVVFLRSQGYAPPERAIDITTGSATIVSSFFGAAPFAMNMMTTLVAGPDAGDQRMRHWSVYASAVPRLLIVAMAGIAADLLEIVPLAFLATLGGLAVIGVLSQMLGAITKGPLKLGPLFAFVVASSQMSVLGFGPMFWALVIGMAVTLLLEQPELQALRATT